MSPHTPVARYRAARRGALAFALTAAAWLAAAGGAAARSPYPAAAQRPPSAARLAQVARLRARAQARAASTHVPRRKRKPSPTLHGDALRALEAFEAMQRHYYVVGSGLYAGEPFSYLWPFSQAFAATVSMANVEGVPKIPGLGSKLAEEVHERLVGLNSYLDLNNSGASEGTFTSTLAAFDGEVAPPVGPGGPKYYDDNDWMGIELVRTYEFTHKAAALGSAEAIMAFEMAGWNEDPQLVCPGGIPFSNISQSTERNTVTNAPAAELALQLYRVTKEAQYLQFAEKAYNWVRTCLLQPNGLYADHIGNQGVIEKTYWSYNQGSMIGAAALLYEATGNANYLNEARSTAAAAQSYFSLQRLDEEIPFFASVYFRDLLYLGAVAHESWGTSLAQAYVNHAWEVRRLPGYVFEAGTPPSAQLLVQAAIVQVYALLASPPSTYF
ncbi:MAG TPA: glycoside hydrolase family 76 protein [Solirubrobacteraceae bacterium]|nr:glycoside hydrolase family 76 protein [Solirubrobacteraceae bacterium]